MINENDLTMEVQFTQTFTIRPPDFIKDNVMADEWFHDDPKTILWDALDVDQGEVEVLSIDESRD